MLYSFRPTLITEKFFLIFSVKANLSNIVTDPNYATDDACELFIWNIYSTVHVIVL